MDAIFSLPIVLLDEKNASLKMSAALNVMTISANPRGASAITVGK